MEYLLRAVCYTTFQVLTVVESSAVLIRTNYFLELFNSLRDPSVEQLSIDADVTQMIETTNEMFGGCSASGDSGVEFPNAIHQQEAQDEAAAIAVAEVEDVIDVPTPDLITDWNIVPTKV